MHAVTIIPFGDVIAPVDKKYWFKMNLESLPRSQDEIAIVGAPNTLKELTGASVFNGIVDSVNHVFSVDGELRETQLTVIIDEEIENEILEAKGE